MAGLRQGVRARPRTLEAVREDDAWHLVASRGIVPSADAIFGLGPDSAAKTAATRDPAPATPEALFAAWRAAARSADGRTIYLLSSAEARRRIDAMAAGVFGAGTGDEVVAAVLSRTMRGASGRRHASYTLDRVVRHGDDRADILVRSSLGGATTLPAVREAGAWRMTADALDR